MGKSSGWVLHLKLINCNDLQAFNFFQKLSVHAVVSIVSDDPSKNHEQKQRTPADAEGDKNPEWNHEMRFDIDCDVDDDLFLHFDLRSDIAIFGERSLGDVRVLLKDLFEDSSNGIVRFVSYEVRTSDRKPNGVLNFSYKVLNALNSGGIGETCNNSPIFGGYPVVDRPPEDFQNLPIQSQDESYHAAMAAASHHDQIHYPSLEDMSYPPPPAAGGESYMNYALHRPHHHDLFHYPPPPPPSFPPPPPPPPYYQGGGYQLPSPWGYEQSYPRPPNPWGVGGDYAYPYYTGDQTRHC